MQQKAKLSKPITLVMGVLFLAMAALAIYMKMSIVGSVILILIGIIGIVGTIIGKFEDGEQN